MKRIFTLITLIGCIASASATDYKGNLAVILNGASAGTQQTTIAVNQQPDGKYELQLHDFILGSGEDMIPVGNIDLKDVPATETDGKITLSAKQAIYITEGSDVSPYWLGPGLCDEGPIDIEMSATIAGGALKARIDIPFGFLNINVLFTSATMQIPNSDFELFHKEKSGSKSGDEPNHWHSFLSATGDYAAAQNTFSAVHTAISTDIRPNSTGKSSLLIKSTNVFGITANGTVTTGRMVAGSMTATDPANHALLDLSNGDKDANGDPFYTKLAARPDSLVCWVKFNQAKAVAAAPYATVNAVITDGTRYQDPEDKTYTNVVAKATDAEIVSDNTWKRLALPFDYATYAGNNAEAKAILVTISTNAKPGKGNAGDQLFVDDLELVYNPKLTGITAFGKEITGFDPKTTEYNITVDKTPTADDIKGIGAENTVITYMDTEASTATILAFGEDLRSTASYTVKYTIDTTGIEDNKIAADGKKVTGVYNLNGQQVHQKQPGQIYVTKYADGTTVKTLNK